MIFPIEIIICILSFSCGTCMGFYNYLLLSKSIHIELLKSHSVIEKTKFVVSNKTIEYFIKNIKEINKNKWIKTIFININMITNLEKILCVFENYMVDKENKILIFKRDDEIEIKVKEYDFELEKYNAKFLLRYEIIKYIMIIIHNTEKYNTLLNIKFNKIILDLYYDIKGNPHINDYVHLHNIYSNGEYSTFTLEHVIQIKNEVTFLSKKEYIDTIIKLNDLCILNILGIKDILLIFTEKALILNFTRKSEIYIFIEYC